MSKTSVINRFWLLLAPDSKEIRNIYIFAIFSGILSLGLPLGIQMIINFIQLGQVSTSWFVLVILVVVAIGFSGVLNIFQLRITENLQQRVFTRSAFEFADRIPKMKMEVLLKRYIPEITNRFFDTISIQKGLSKILIDTSAALLQILFGLVLLSFYHSFFIFLGFFLLMLLFIVIRFTVKKGFQTSMDESTVKYKIANWLDEISQARMSFKLSGLNFFNLNQTNNLLNNYLSAREKHFKVLVQQYGFLILFKVLIALFLLVLGGVLVLNQQMNIGQFVAAEIIILLVLNSVEKLILSLEVIYDVMTAIEKIGQITDIPIESESGVSFDGMNETITIDISNVSHSFHGFQNPILSDVSFNIKSGEKICFVTDSSLSTNALYCLLLGIYDFQKGSISLNGIPVSDLNKFSFRSTIGTVMKQDHFINASIFDNISFGRSEIGMPIVSKIMEELHLNDFLNQTADKFNSIINPELNTIPADVAQRMLIARALASNPKLLLMEDPTSGMNSEQATFISEKIKNLENITMLLTSFDEEILKVVDRVIEIKAGKIVFEGSYKELKNRKDA
jgi:ABC-type bacteriocin/lantibiotic exporter with double-glycine peptidase domain